MNDMPRYDAAPESFEPWKATTPPPIMNTIFFMLLGAAVLQIAATLLAVMSVNSPLFRGEIEQQLRSQDMPGITPELIDTAVTFALVSAIAIGVVAVIVYVPIALSIKKGRGWARTVGAVLAVLSLGQLIGLTMPGGIAVIVQVMLGIGAIVLCFMPPAAGYFTAQKAYSLASKNR